MKQEELIEMLRNDGIPIMCCPNCEGVLLPRDQGGSVGETIFDCPRCNCVHVIQGSEEGPIPSWAL